LKHPVDFYENRSVHELITKNTAEREREREGGGEGEREREGEAMLTVAPGRYNLRAY
jgi:hypothetical protein